MSGSGDLVDLRVRRTHKLLWEALMELMSEQEFTSISVQEICHRAMVHRTTFYKHYRDKYDLLTNGMRSIHEPLAAAVGTPFQDASHDSLSTYFRGVFVHVADNESFYRMVLYGNRACSFRSWLQEYMAESISSTMAGIEQLGGAFPAPVPVLAHFYAGAVLSTLGWWLANGRPYPPDQMGRYMGTLLA